MPRELPESAVWFHLSSYFEGATLEIHPASYSAETWDYDTEIGTVTASPRAVVNSIVSWANDAARNWSGSWTASASYASAANNGQVAVTIAGSTGTTAWSPSVELNLAYGWSSASSQNLAGDETVGSVECSGIGWSRWFRTHEVRGYASGGGGWHNAHFASDRHGPVVLLYMTQAQTMALTAARESLYTRNPRQADVYDHEAETWRAVSVAKITQRKAGIELYAAAFDQALGVA